MLRYFFFCSVLFNLLLCNEHINYEQCAGTSVQLNSRSFPTTLYNSRLFSLYYFFISALSCTEYKWKCQRKFTFWFSSAIYMLALHRKLHLSFPFCCCCCSSLYKTNKTKDLNCFRKHSKWKNICFQNQETEMNLIAL